MSNETTRSSACRMFRRVEAAAYVTEAWRVPLSPKTLSKLAVLGGGPAFRKIGRYPLYEQGDLDDWVLSRSSKKVRSTSELLFIGDQSDRKT